MPVSAPQPKLEPKKPVAKRRTNVLAAVIGTAIAVPFSRGSFFVPNMPQHGKAYHQVTLTRPFWMSKFEITVEQLRDLFPNDYEGCREIERETKGKYPLYRNESYGRLFAFCSYLSKRYRSQLPAGYVFRLPTDAET